MRLQFEKILYGDDDTQLVGHHIAEQLKLAKTLQGSVITLSGELGAGKTTFSRGFIHNCGYDGAVKSPTYTIIETYPGSVCEICHLDLYRLEDEEELEYIGFRDLLAAEVVMLIEWPERVNAMTDIATISIELEHRDARSRMLRVCSAQALFSGS